MQTITYISENCTYVYRSGRYKEVREVTPIFAAAHAISTKWPEMTSRVWKAAVIFTDGLVSLLPVEDQAVHSYDLLTATDMAIVRSKPDDSGYMVRRLHWRDDLAPGEPLPNHDHKFSCECFDYTEGKAPVIRGQVQCKHIMATRIALKKRDEAQAQTMPEQLDTVVITETEVDHRQPAHRKRSGITREIAEAHTEIFANMRRGSYGRASGGTRIMEARKP